MSWLELNPEVLGINRMALADAIPGAGYSKAYIPSPWQVWPVQPLQQVLTPSFGSGKGITTTTNLMGLRGLGNWSASIPDGQSLEASTRGLTGQPAINAQIAGSALEAALQAAGSQDRTRYESNIRRASEAITKLYATHLNLASRFQASMAQVQSLAQRHFSRSSADQAVYQAGKDAAAAAHSRYRDYPTTTDWTRDAEAAARKTAADLARLPGKAVGAITSTNTLLLAAAAIGIYAFAGGLGKGLGSSRRR